MLNHLPLLPIALVLLILIKIASDAPKEIAVLIPFTLLSILAYYNFYFYFNYKDLFPLMIVLDVFPGTILFLLLMIAINREDT
jgi:hypothetical protein